MCIYIVRYATLKLPPALPSPLFAMRDIRMTVTAKTAPEPRVMAKFSVTMKEYAGHRPQPALAAVQVAPGSLVRERQTWFGGKEILRASLEVFATMSLYWRRFGSSKDG